MNEISKYAEQGYVDTLAYFGCVEKDAGIKEVAQKVVQSIKNKPTQAKFLASGAKDEAVAAGKKIKDWAGKNKDKLIPAAVGVGAGAVGTGAGYAAGKSSDKKGRS